MFHDFVLRIYSYLSGILNWYHYDYSVYIKTRVRCLSQLVFYTIDRQYP